jgi:uncharacterized protein YchJ
MARKLTARFEDGHVQKRQTDRAYTHCWRVFIPAGVSERFKREDGSALNWNDHWVYGWSHSEVQATKTARQRCALGAGRRFEVAPSKAEGK